MLLIEKNANSIDFYMTCLNLTFVYHKYIFFYFADFAYYDGEYICISQMFRWIYDDENKDV